MENINWQYIGNIKGEKGDVGKGLTILDYRTTADELPLEASAGDAYGVGNGEPYDIYIYSPTKGWVNNGPLQGVKVETKPYTGNGLNGVENAHEFTFSFIPKIFYISGCGRDGGNYTLTVPYGLPNAHIVVHSDGGFATMTCEFQYNENVVTMYTASSPENGFNTNGKPYTITALG